LENKGICKSVRKNYIENKNEKLLEEEIKDIIIPRIVFTQEK